MRRFGCAPTLVIIAMALALIAVAGVALSNTAVTLASIATATISQILLVAVLGGIILILIGSIALRDPLIRSIVAKRFNQAPPRTPDLPAAPVHQIQPVAKQIVAKQIARTKRRVFHVPHDF